MIDTTQPTYYTNYHPCSRPPLMVLCLTIERFNPYLVDYTFNFLLYGLFPCDKFVVKILCYSLTQFGYLYSYTSSFWVKAIHLSYTKSKNRDFHINLGII